MAHPLAALLLVAAALVAAVEVAVEVVEEEVVVVAEWQWQWQRVTCSSSLPSAAATFGSGSESSAICSFVGTNCAGAGAPFFGFGGGLTNGMKVTPPMYGTRTGGTLTPPFVW